MNESTIFSMLAATTASLICAAHFVHVSECREKYLTRAEFDEHLAACRLTLDDKPRRTEIAAKRVEEMRDGNDSRRDSEN